MMWKFKDSFFCKSKCWIDQFNQNRIEVHIYAFFKNKIEKQKG